MMPYILNIEQEGNCKCFDFFHKKNISIHNQYFNLGYILLISALGGLNFESLTNYLDSESIINYNDKCCLLHLLLENEKNSKSKIKISNFINSHFFSENFINFLCLTLTFQPKSNQNSLVMNHPWIKISTYIYMNNKLNKVRVNMKEIIKISRRLLNLDNINSMDLKLNIFMNKMEIIVQNNKSIRKEEVLTWLESKNEVIKDLSEEFGVESSVLINKLQNKLLHVK